MRKSNLWQLRLGERGQGKPDWRKAFLDDKYSLISIDYGIKEDIRDMDEEEIKTYIKKINAVPEVNPRAVNLYIRQILNFKNKIKKGDYVISPFNYLEGGKKFRIGRIVGDMGTLESLFEKKLAHYLPKKAYSSRLKNPLTIDDCRNLPTHKVEWLTGEFSESDLNAEIQPKLKTGAGIGSVAKLNFSGNLPYELVPEAIFQEYSIRKPKRINEGIKLASKETARPERIDKISQNIQTAGNINIAMDNHGSNNTITNNLMIMDSDGSKNIAHEFALKENKSKAIRDWIMTIAMVIIAITAVITLLVTLGYFS